MRIPFRICLTLPLLVLLFIQNTLALPTQPVATQEYFLDPPLDNGPAKVYAAFQLRNINEINDQAETYQISGLLTLKWKDKRQAFDPQVAQVAEKIYQGNFQFNEVSPAWYPQIILNNEAGMFDVNGVLLRILPDGTSTLIQTVNAVAKGNFDMRRYPFDAQTLNLIFEILGFDKNEVVLENDPQVAATAAHRVKISQWNFTGITAATALEKLAHADKLGASSTFILKIAVERDPFFMVRLVLLPLGLIVILSWSVFWMDRSSLGDRINVSFIGILTAVAYQIVVSDILPHISYVTFMNSFLNLSLLTMSASVVVNLVVAAYDKQGRVKLGDVIDRRCRVLFPCIYFGLLLCAWLAVILLF